MKFKKPNFLSKKALLVGLALLISLIFPIYFANADAEEAISMVVAVILKIVLYIVGLFFYLGGVILDKVILHALNIQNANVVNAGWTICRDIANMFFVIALLAIAFATILRIEAYQYKALLPKLILGILLVNFSRTITSVFIEFSNLLVSAFLHFTTSGSTASAVLSVLGINTIYQVDDAFDAEKIKNFTMLLGLFFVVFMVALLAMTLVGLAGMLVFRMIVLLVLIVLSPIAFAFSVLPATKKFFEQWWQNFFKYLFYAPAAAFCLYLALETAQEVGVGKESVVGLGKNLQTGGKAVLAGTGVKIIPNEMVNNWEYLWGFLLVIGLLMLSISLIQQGGGIFANFLMKAAKVEMLGGMALIGAGIGRRISRGLARAGSGEGVTSRLIRAVGNKFKPGFGEKYDRFLKEGFTIKGRKIQPGKALKALRFLSPQVTLAAHRARQEELDQRAYTQSIGWAHEVMNRAFLDKDRLPYEQIARSEEVGREMERWRRANPKNDYVEYVRQFASAVDRGAPDSTKEALYNLIAEQDNPNEFYSRIFTHPNWESLKHKLFPKEWLDEHRKELERGEMPMNPHDADIPMLIHLFGNERAKFISSRLAGIDLARDKRMGSHVGSTDVDWRTGKLRWRCKGDPRRGRKEDWEEMFKEQAGQADKMGADAFNRMSRFCFVDLRAKKTKDEEGKVIVEEKAVKPSGGFEYFLKERGGSVTDEAVKRFDRYMAGLKIERLNEIIPQIEEAIRQNPNEAIRRRLERWKEKVKEVRGREESSRGEYFEGGAGI